jgi:hypothetical protein
VAIRYARQGVSACHIPDVSPFPPAAALFATVQEIGSRARFTPIAIRPPIRIFPQRHAFDLQTEGLPDHRASPNKKSNTESGRVYAGLTIVFEEPNGAWLERRRYAKRQGGRKPGKNRDAAADNR